MLLPESQGVAAKGLASQKLEGVGDTDSETIVGYDPFAHPHLVERKRCASDVRAVACRTQLHPVVKLILRYQQIGGAPRKWTVSKLVQAA